MIELVISMTLIIIAIVPVTSVIWSGLRAASASMHRTDAFAIAARETESLHADPYALVGFYGDQLSSPWKNNTTVVVGSCSSTCPTPFAPLILPVGSAVLSGVTYSIARYVYWMDAVGLNNASTSTTFSQAYKATTVVVGWADPTGTRSVEQDSIVYPGGLGLYSGPGGSSPSTTSTTAALVAPDAPTLSISGSQPAAPQNQQEIDLNITAAAGGSPVTVYYVQWSTDSTFPAPSQSPQLPPTSTTYAAQGLAAATTYYLRIFAGNTSGQSPYSAVVSAATAAFTAATTTMPGTTIPATTTTTVACNLGAFTITTATTGKTYLAKTTGQMSENIVLNLAVNGACPWPVTVSSVLHGTTTADPGAPYVLAGPPTGGQWVATVVTIGQANWSVGTHDMTVLMTGTITPVSHGLLVCAYKPKGQRSPLSTAC
jgi:Tfp pilus assembly protein PilV